MNGKGVVSQKYTAARANKVKEIIGRLCLCEEAELTAEADLQNDLGADSLDMVELVMSLEEEFEIEIPDDLADQLKTVQQFVDYIEKHHGGSHA